jgi:hypothetical protein
VPNGELRIGMPVEVVFDEVTPEITLVRFGRPGDIHGGDAVMRMAPALIGMLALGWSTLPASGTPAM